MAQKGKVRELQEDLKIQRQAAKALGEYCTKYKKEIETLRGRVKILTIQNVMLRWSVGTIKYNPNNHNLNSLKDAKLLRDAINKDYENNNRDTRVQVFDNEA